MSNPTQFSSGLLILVQGDTGNKKWWNAQPWQSTAFIKAMEFGTMKTMGAPNPVTYTKPFTHGEFQYRFIIKNDWGPCAIHNMSTGKERTVLYFDVGDTLDNIGHTDPIAVSKITYV